MVRPGRKELQIFSNINMWLKGLIQYVFLIVNYQDTLFMFGIPILG